MRRTSGPDCPEYFAEDEQRHFASWCDALSEANALASADCHAIAAAALASARLERAILMLRQTGGEVLVGPNGGTYQNPWTSIATKATDQIRSLSNDLGVTWKARRVRGAKAPRASQEPAKAAYFARA